MCRYLCWTKGGWVNSQVFDHTSLIRFLEARFGDEYPDLIETNITPWRRAVAGDLTSIFNFANPNATPAFLPSAAAYLPPNKKLHPDYPVDDNLPAVQELPVQEQGIRPSRALPYALHAHGKANAAADTFEIDFTNIGKATAVFHVRSGDSTVAPRCFTVEPNKNLAGNWNSDAGDYNLSVYGPNGFFRSFKGNALDGNPTNLDVSASYDETKISIKLSLANLSAQTAKIHVHNRYTGNSLVKELKTGESLSKSWALARVYGWYDLVITVEGDTSFEYRFAGHVESGKDSYSDPIMGGLCNSSTACVTL